MNSSFLTKNILKLKAENKSLQSLLELKSRLFDEDLPDENLKIVSKVISKYPSEYAVKYQILKNEVDILKEELAINEKTLDFFANMIEFCDISKFSLNENLADFISEAYFHNKININLDIQYKGFVDSLDDDFSKANEFTDELKNVKAFSYYYIKTKNIKSILNCIYAFPFENGYMIFEHSKDDFNL